MNSGRWRQSSRRTWVRRPRSRSIFVPMRPVAPQSRRRPGDSRAPSVQRRKLVAVRRKMLATGPIRSAASSSSSSASASGSRRCLHRHAPCPLHRTTSLPSRARLSRRYALRSSSSSPRWRSLSRLILPHDQHNIVWHHDLTLLCAEERQCHAPVRSTSERHQHRRAGVVPHHGHR